MSLTLLVSLYVFNSGNGTDTLIDFSGDGYGGDGLGRIVFNGVTLGGNYKLKTNRAAVWGDDTWTLNYAAAPGGTGLLSISKVGGTDKLLIRGFRNGDLPVAGAGTLRPHHPTAFEFRTIQPDHPKTPIPSGSTGCLPAPSAYAFRPIDRHNAGRYIPRHSHPAAGTGGGRNVRLSGPRVVSEREMIGHGFAGNDAAWAVAA